MLLPFLSPFKPPQPSEIPPPTTLLGDFLSQGGQNDLAVVLEFQNQNKSSRADLASKHRT